MAFERKAGCPFLQATSFRFKKSIVQLTGKIATFIYLRRWAKNNTDFDNLRRIYHSTAKGFSGEPRG